jgi:hypothetical protein
MRKNAYFDSYWGEGWPSLDFLRPYFLDNPAARWPFVGRNDSASLSGEGLYGTEPLEPRTGRVDVDLSMYGVPQFGIMLQYDLWDGRIARLKSFSSKGDLRRRLEFARTVHRDPISIGLFIDFSQAWRAVEEFIATDGELPGSIAWVAAEDLPPDTFPAPTLETIGGKGGS